VPGPSGTRLDSVPLHGARERQRERVMALGWTASTRMKPMCSGANVRR
jgi:hypothetical protein